MPQNLKFKVSFIEMGVALNLNCCYFCNNSEKPEFYNYQYVRLKISDNCFCNTRDITMSILHGGSSKVFKDKIFEFMCHLGTPDELKDDIKKYIKKRYYLCEIIPPLLQDWKSRLNEEATLPALIEILETLELNEHANALKVLQTSEEEKTLEINVQSNQEFQERNFSNSISSQFCDTPVLVVLLLACLFFVTLLIYIFIDTGKHERFYLGCTKGVVLDPYNMSWLQFNTPENIIKIVSDIELCSLSSRVVFNNTAHALCSFAEMDFETCPFLKEYKTLQNVHEVKMVNFIECDFIMDMLALCITVADLKNFSYNGIMTNDAVQYISTILDKASHSVEHLKLSGIFNATMDVFTKMLNKQFRRLKKIELEMLNTAGSRTEVATLATILSEKSKSVSSLNIITPIVHSQDITGFLKSGSLHSIKIAAKRLIVNINEIDAWKLSHIKADFPALDFEMILEICPSEYELNQLESLVLESRHDVTFCSNCKKCKLTL